MSVSELSPPARLAQAVAAPPHVEVRDLLIRRGGRDILHIERLAIQRGEIVVLVGPNGAGKSTLMTALALIDKPAAGSITWDGTPVDWKRGALTVRRRLAIVFQEPLLFDTTVSENVATGLKLRGVGPAERAPRVRRWLERLGVLPLAGRQARTLSGGEAQRTSLARALVLEPELLLLDEPFASLDAPTRETLADDLIPLLRESRTTTLLVTHDREEALEFGDRLAVILNGRLAQLDTPERILAAPASEAVAAFFTRRRRGALTPTLSQGERVGVRTKT